MVEAQEREEPLSEAKAGKILDAVCEKALNGIPMVSRSVDEIADDYLSRHDTPEAAARSLARWQVAKCGTSGFLSGLGGIVTLLVTGERNSMPDQAPLPGDATGDMNYREAEAVTVSCFAERMENIRRLSTYDSDALSTGLYSPRSKGILSEYSDCPSQTMV